MPDVSILHPELETLSPAELQSRRAELLHTMQTKYKGYDDVDLPEEILHELLCLTQMLRRKSSGPPRAKKEPKTGSKVSAADLMDSI